MTKTLEKLNSLFRKYGTWREVSERTIRKWWCGAEASDESKRKVARAR